MHQRSLACGCGAGDEGNFTGAGLEFDPHENRGRAISSIDARHPDKDSAFEEVNLCSVRSGHDWTS